MSQNDMDMLYSNINEMLRQEASLIESADTEIGTVDVDELMVPITFILIPKEIGEHTAVSLNFDDELFPMERDGITFTATIARNIFSDALPKIVIDEDGTRKITEDNQIGIRSIKKKIFPVMIPRLSGEARFSNGTYRRKGNLSINTKKTSFGIEFKKARLAIKVGDRVVSDKIIPDETLSEDSHGYEINEKISLDDGQVCTMTVIAVDSIGLEHHYNVDHWVAGSGPQREPLFDDEKIYSADGKLLWEQKMEPLY